MQQIISETRCDRPLLVHLSPEKTIYQVIFNYFKEKPTQIEIKKKCERYFILFFLGFIFIVESVR